MKPVHLAVSAGSGIFWAALISLGCAAWGWSLWTIPAVFGVAFAVTYLALALCQATGDREEMYP